MSDALPHGLLLGWTHGSERRPGGDSFPQPLWAENDDSHLITVAPTGAGKGVSCIIPALLTWRGPAIVIDPKGENYAVTARRRKEMGQRVHVLDPFNVTECESPASLNPFDLIDAHLRDREEDIQGLADTLVMQKNSRWDPYWDERATYLIAEAIRYVIHGLGKDQASLADVRTVVQAFAGTPERYFAGREDGHPSYHPRITTVFAPVGISSDRTRASIVSTACSHLGFLRPGSVEDCLSRSTINLTHIGQGVPLTVYLVLPPDKLLSHGKLLRLWLGVMLRTIARRSQIPSKPTLLLVDEAAQLGPLDELRSAITLMRGYGLRVWSFWQDLSQLRRIYPLDWESLLNNCAVQQFFGAANPQSAAQLQEYMRDCLPKPITSLKPNESVLVRPRLRPAIVRTADYRHDAMFRNLYAVNPFHMRSLMLVDTQEVFEVEERDGATILTFPKREER